MSSWLSILSPALVLIGGRLLLNGLLGLLLPGEISGSVSTILMTVPVLLWYRQEPKREKKAPEPKIWFWCFLTVPMILVNRLLFGGKPVPMTVLGVLSSVVCGPVTEEVIYRGMVCRRAEKTVGRTATVVLSSLLFGIAHRGLPAMSAAALYGVLFCLLDRNCKTLLAPIATHMLLNLSAIL